MYPLLLVSNYALLALTFVISKQVVALAHPLVVISLRMTVGGSLLLLIATARNRAYPKIAKGSGFLFFKVAFFHIYLAFVAEFWALQYLSSSHVNIIYSFTPLCSAALSYLINGEALNRGKLHALGLGLIGLAPNFFNLRSVASGKVHLLAEIALFTAVISSTYAWFDISKLMKSHSILLINGLSMLIGGMGAFFTSLIVLKSTDFFIFNPISLTIHIAALIFLSNFLFYNFFGLLLRRYTLNLLTFAGLLSPLFGAVWGKIFLGEKVENSFFLSITFLFIALIIFFKEDKLKNI